MKEFEFCTIQENDEGKTKKLIIPTSLPSFQIVYIDVSELSEDNRESALDAAKAYNEYAERYMTNMFSFDDFLNHIDHPASSLSIEVKVTTMDLIDKVISN